MGGVTYPTLPMQEAVHRPQSAYGPQSAACSPSGSFARPLPPQPHSAYFSGMTGPQHPFYNRVRQQVLQAGIGLTETSKGLKKTLVKHAHTRPLLFSLTLQYFLFIDLFSSFVLIVEFFFRCPSFSHSFVPPVCLQPYFPHHVYHQPRHYSNHVPPTFRYSIKPPGQAKDNIVGLVSRVCPDRTPSPSPFQASAFFLRSDDRLF